MFFKKFLDGDMFLKKFLWIKLNILGSSVKQNNSDSKSTNKLGSSLHTSNQVVLV